MAAKRYRLRARVSTEAPQRVGPILHQRFPAGSVSQGSEPNEFLVDASVEGESARDLNRDLLTALRQGEKRTRLRAEWTWNGTTERFFDYVPKGTKKE